MGDGQADADAVVRARQAGAFLGEGFEKVRQERLVDADTPSGENPRDDLRQTGALGNGKRGA